MKTEYLGINKKERYICTALYDCIIEFYYCFIQEMAEKRKLYKLSLEYAKKLLLLQ